MASAVQPLDYADDEMMEDSPSHQFKFSGPVAEIDDLPGEKMDKGQSKGLY